MRATLLDVVLDKSFLGQWKAFVKETIQTRYILDYPFGFSLTYIYQKA